jgi:hypothetical protein
VIEWTPFQTYYYSEHLAGLRIEPGIFVSAARNSDHETIKAVRLTKESEINFGVRLIDCLTIKSQGVVTANFHALLTLELNLNKCLEYIASVQNIFYFLP